MALAAHGGALLETPRRARHVPPPPPPPSY